jgi:hypothetical protein
LYSNRFLTPAVLEHLKSKGKLKEVTLLKNHQLTQDPTSRLTRKMVNFPSNGWQYFF